MYEVVEAVGEWIVRQEGLEVARYAGQTDALEAVAERIRADCPRDRPITFAMRFASRDQAADKGAA